MKTNNKAPLFCIVFALSSVLSTQAYADTFPALGEPVMPITSVPHWGAMRTPEEWSRSYSEITEEDFIPLPEYDLSVLTTPLLDLIIRRTKENDMKLTAKLTYSTRFFGKYDLDSDEYTGDHEGIDIKLAKGTPIASIAGGRIKSINQNERLGTHVVIEHRIDGESIYSTYGHLDEVKVSRGDDVIAGEIIATIGMTGNTNNPHLHLQIEKGEEILHPIHFVSSPY